MTYEQLNNRVAVINAEVKRINNERQVSIGRKEALSTQLADAVRMYQEIYGVSLSAENIDDEINKLLEAKEKEVDSISAVIARIQEGNYSEAEKLLGVEAGVDVTPVQDEVETSEHVQGEAGVPWDVHRGAGVSESIMSKVEVSGDIQSTVGVSEPVVSTPPVMNKTVEELGATEKVGLPPMRVLNESVSPALESPSPLLNDGHIGGTGVSAGLPDTDGFMQNFETQEDAGEPPLAAPPFTTLKVETPTKPTKPITSFDQIIGGSIFNPQ